MKLIEVHRANTYSPFDAEIHDIVIIPTFIIVLRSGQEDSRLKFWHCRIEWLEWYVSIGNPFNKRIPRKG